MFPKSLNALTLIFISVLVMFATVSQGAPIAVRRSKVLVDRRDASSSGAKYSGDATYYEPGLGACGETNAPGDSIVAIAAPTFDKYPGATSNPNNNPICNKPITIYYGSKSVTATITDRCAGCAGEADIDMTSSLFQSLVGDLGKGRVSITWKYN
ncbi:plant expansin [Lentinula raphanica]|uniref:Plant expansin n=1 Tax=Lentinula raphanica TaxID=153919 RepID=A0AA38UCW3_9AGAR|nr:plant expansin [Lentinula raphanica]KAJ3965835.1 plant expansin [Lentinula raphanica]